MTEPKRCPMLFGFCKHGHPRTKETTFERKVTKRTESGWERSYIVRECRICHSQRNTKAKIYHTSTSKWKRFMAGAA
jgi:hypothetical protein